MRTSVAAFAALAVAVSSFPAGAQDAVAPLPIDPRIAAAVANVSAERLRATDEKLVAFGTRSTFSEKSGPNRGIFAARDWLAAQFGAIAATTGGRMTVTYDTYTQEQRARIPRAVPISSVIATLKGDDPSGRTIVLSSHLDSRNSDNDDGTADAPGADDNASAVAQALEVARVLAPMHFHATIVFAAFDSEEQGLLGSGHFAKTLKDAGANVDADLNSDIIGSSTAHDGTKHPYDVRLFSEAVATNVLPSPGPTAKPLDAAGTIARLDALGIENDSPSRELARFCKETGEAYVPAMHIAMIYRMDRFLRGGDQTSFAEQGFPAVRYVEAAENFDHQHQNVRTEKGVEYGDLVKFMDFAYLARVTQINAADVATLAAGPSKPGAVKIVAKELGYDTTLTWAAVPFATAYEIVRRRSQEQSWSVVTNVGNVTTATLPVSKDDWLFGVRSVDAAGHRSVAVFPDVAR
jgi:Zn-dependent M28 family amino/carboxypeptidase